MNRKLGLMCAAILTLAILWAGTTGAAWASPASATVPPGTGPYRLFVASSNGIAQHATYKTFTAVGTLPVGLKFLLKGADVTLYSATWKVVGGKVVVCGLIPPTKRGQIYKRNAALKWLPLPSSTNPGNPKMICALSTPGKFVVVGR